ncbi:VOC family protein [Marilutibacter chinensis]|uniref:VOC family protein n=1 Tax=Marilutibacter chinensis TaxID=2912247 RepID=A0ABS9HXH9_9GAMM|nr:VOC family protein [Lysobacter chinensis]MCF7221221.1 VOC family protein [Lysobacter chinensis]MCF7223038.1 VOC family protein [Lysobacter chinensis]
MQFIPYMCDFGGKCREAFDFYAKALGGEVVGRMTYGESPMCDQMPPDSRDLVMHSCLMVGDAVIMGADGPPPENAGTDSTTINVTVDTPEDAERVWAAMTDGGEIKMPLQETFWALRWGMLVDRYGKPWMINCLRASEDCPTPGKAA